MQSSRCRLTRLHGWKSWLPLLMFVGDPFPVNRIVGHAMTITMNLVISRLEMCEKHSLHD